ncbi:MAG: hypothetical protein HY895_13985 [Deltaproteobacteria bacterium]|nr:hypothetical protein [Deltaproteobacteria bacterium]
MKNHEKRHKELSGTEVKRDRKKESGEEGFKEDLKPESHAPFDADEDTTARISFLIDFSLAEGQIEGRIIHRLTNKHMKFVGLDQTAISQFMKKYLSRLDKSVVRATEREQVPSTDYQDAEKEEAAAASNEIRTKSFLVIPAGAAQPTEILQQGQPFQVQWCFDPPASLSVRGQHMNYKVSICRKKLASGHREVVGEIEGDVACSEALTASIHSEPLPSGTYRLEADATFSLKGRKPDWSGVCRDSRLVHVA